jgi:hypothetical protein
MFFLGEIRRPGMAARYAPNQRHLVREIAARKQFCGIPRADAASIKTDEAVKGPSPDGFEKSAKLRRAKLKE